MADDGLTSLTATQAAEEIARGAVSAEDYARACLERIDVVEGEVQAFAHLDRDHVLAQARALDEQRAQGRPIGPLHGIPVGIKDIIDTTDYPTELGSPLGTGRRPWQDATAVAKLRAAGAVIIGKTVTTEFAYFQPGKTRNPHDPTRTPGGSSSGSAAAVAANMVPLALGSQTNGSVIRPAAFCGVFAVKPSHGLVSRAGVLMLSRAAIAAALRLHAHAGLGQDRCRHQGGVRGVDGGARIPGRAGRSSADVGGSLGRASHHHGDRHGA